MVYRAADFLTRRKLACEPGPNRRTNSSEIGARIFNLLRNFLDLFLEHIGLFAHAAADPQRPCELLRLEIRGEEELEPALVDSREIVVSLRIHLLCRERVQTDIRIFVDRHRNENHGVSLSKSKLHLQ